MSSPFSHHEAAPASYNQARGTTELHFSHIAGTPGAEADDFYHSYAEEDDSDELFHEATPESADEESESPVVDDETQDEDGETEDAWETFNTMIEAVADTIRPHTETEMLKMRGLAIRQAGYNADNIDFSDATRKALAARAHHDASDALESTRKLWMENIDGSEDDVFDTVFRRIAADMHGEMKDSTSRIAPPDSAYFKAGSTIQEAIENGEIDVNSSLVRAKATAAVDLLTAYGLYKMNAWSGSNSATLMEGLQLMEACAINIPGFNPDHAGYETTKTFLMATQAAVSADFVTKPNYQYARPGLGAVLRTTHSALRQMERTEAVMLLENYPLEELVGPERAQELIAKDARELDEARHAQELEEEHRKQNESVA